MQIDSVAYKHFVQMSYVRAAGIERHDKNDPPATSAGSQGDRLSISAQARGVAASQIYTSSGHTLIKCTPEMFAESAGARVRQLLQGLGIPENTPVKITADTQGTISIKVDHPDGARIEAALSDDGPLRDLVLMGRHAAGLERVSQASMQAYETLPTGDEEALARAQQWLEEVIRETNNMPYVTYLNGNSSSASFEDGEGNIVDYMNNLKTPKFT